MHFETKFDTAHGDLGWELALQLAARPYIDTVAREQMMLRVQILDEGRAGAGQFDLQAFAGNRRLAEWRDVDPRPCRFG
jgi:hypothetical protein